MQVCPRCGVRNLDSDIQCFNCESILDGRPFRPGSSAAEGAVPAGTGPAGTAAGYGARPAPPRGRGLTLGGLLLGSLLSKLLGMVMAFGLFSIAALVVIWVDYTNPTAFHLTVGLLGAGALAAFLYPGVARAGLNRNRGWLVALLSDLAIFAAFLPPAVIVMEKKLSGASELILRFWWAVPATLALDILVSQASGMIARRRAGSHQAGGRGAARAARTDGPLSGEGR